MSGWAKRRFWTEVAVAQADDGFTIALDGRPVRTPARAPLAVPTRALADRIATEWRAQEQMIDPGAMPATRAANAAIDKVRGQHAEVAAMIAAYGDADLICYRAKAPEGLVAAEAAAWDPLVDWAAARFEARLTVCAGVIHHPQPPEALHALRAPVTAMSAFELTALHDLVSLTGSLVIGLAAAEDRDTPGALWAASRIEEEWQIAQWGEDAEARTMTEARRRAFLEAKAFLDALRLP